MGLGKRYCGRLHTPTFLHTDQCATNSASERQPFEPDPPIAHWGPRPVDVVNEVDWMPSIGRDTARAAELLGGDMGARPATGTTKFLGVDEAAELLSISKRTIYGWVQQGRIPYRKAGRRVLFLESELMDWTKPGGCHQSLELIR